MKTIIITGVLGFIGSHTAKAFKQAGYKVIGIDKAWTMKEGSFFCDQLFIDDFVNITANVAKVNSVDAIIHIAGTSLVGPSIADPGEYYRNNVAKTNQMLDDLALAEWKGNIVFSSSAATYGNNCHVPILESAQGIPVSPYGHSKKMCEHVIEDHTRAYGHRSIALRYFNACGCDTDGELGNTWNDTHLIPKVVQAIIEKQPFTINGTKFSTNDGTCIRDYLHVTDIASAHVQAVALCDDFKTGTFKAYNLGTGHGYSNLEIVQAVKSVTQGNLKIIYGPSREGDPDKLIADPSAFIRDAKWLPMNSRLLTIVETTFNWMKKHEMASYRP
jgi:nucleoside-diphosphate-sugar epimerase